MLWLLTVEFVIGVIVMSLSNYRRLIHRGEGGQDDLAKVISGNLRHMVEASNVSLESDQWLRVLCALAIW